MLEVKNLYTGYYKNEIVKGISFFMKNGEFTCIIGANGCGKTTALKGILGILPLFSGKVKMGGKEIISSNKKYNMPAKERAKIFAYIPQIHGLPFPFKVSDVVLLGRTNHLRSSISLPSMEDKMIAWKSMSILGIESIANQEYTKLSGGQQQLVLIARAIAQQPKILIMDEPTASLDFGNQQMVLERLVYLKKRGMSVLMVTHDPSHVLLCADNVVVMDKGRILKEGTPETTITTEILKQIYGVDVVVKRVPLPSGEEVRTVLQIPKYLKEEAKNEKNL